jgi:membrane protease YdiL (CAAX protease family)
MTALPDHLLVILLLFVTPAWGAREYRKLVAEVRAGNTAARLREYRGTVLMEWGLALILLAWWWLAGRNLALLGFDLPPGVRAIAGLVLTAAGLAFLLMQWRAITRLEGQGLEGLRAQVASFAELMPHSNLEYRWFKALSVTAGICEELVFRGFIIWYLGHWMSPWVAAIVSAVAFGLAHFYQGWTGVVKTGVTGLVMGLLFVGTGSLLWPMILHAAVDLQGGAAGRRVLASER